MSAPVPSAGPTRPGGTVLPEVVRRPAGPARGWPAGLAAAAAGLAAFGAYLRTLAPDVTWADSGELLLAAWSLGIAHPPGAPLWVLLGHLATLLPVGSVAWRGNLLSAACAALAVAATARLALALIELPRAARPSDRRPGASPARQRPSASARRGRPEVAPATRPPAWAAPLAGLVGGLALGFSGTFWSFATIAEVYTLALLLVAVGLGALLAWYAGRDAATVLGAPRPLVGAALALGLALASHYSAVFAAPLALALLAGRRVRLTGRGSAVLVAAAALGPSLFLLLPLRAAAAVPLAWGDPRTLDRFLAHVSARQYQGNLFSSPSAVVLEQLGRGLGTLASDLTPPVLLLAALGLGALGRRGARAPGTPSGLGAAWGPPPLVGLLGTVLFSLVVAANYDIAEDWEAYLLVAELALAALAGVGAHALLAFAAPVRPLTVAVGLVLAALPLAALGAHAADQDRSRDRLARNYALNTLAGIEPNGVLLTGEWNLYAPTLYLQHVEGQRTDVAVIDLLLLRRSWYFRHLEERYPWLIAAARPEVAAFREQLARFEAGQPYDPNVIQERFVAMINAFIGAARRDRPVYLTPGWDPGVAAGLSLVPSGLAFRALAPAEEAAGAGLAVALREPAWDLSGVGDGTVPLDPVGRRMLPTYALAETNRGVYLAAHGRWPEAERAFRRALALAPGLAVAQSKLGLALAAQGRDDEALAAFEAALRLDPRNEEARRGRDAARQRRGG